MRTDREILVAGAGPAGGLAATLLARAGADVLLVDRARFPRPKVCGGCLGARAVAALERAGLSDLPERLGAPVLERADLAAGGRRATLSLPPGRALSRTALDAALVRAAVAAGAELREGVAAELLAPGRVRLGDREVTARVVLAADGLAGGLLRQVPDLAPRVAPASRIGAAAEPLSPVPAVRRGTVSMTVGRGGYVGLVRVEDDSLRAAAALDPAAVRDAGGPGPAAAEILAGAGLPEVPGLRDARWTGTPPLTRRRARTAAERLFVIGDAAAYAEPFTGEGMAWAMESALAVAAPAFAAAAVWRPGLARAWEARQRRFATRRQRLSRLLARVLRRPRATALLLAAVDRLPALARPVLRPLAAGSAP